MTDTLTNWAKPTTLKGVLPELKWQESPYSKNYFCVYSRYADVDEYLCQRILTSEILRDMDWVMEISSAHKVKRKFMRNL